MALGTPVTRSSAQAVGSPTTLTISSRTTVADELVIAAVFMYGTGSKVPSSITGHDGKNAWAQIGTVEQVASAFSVSIWASHSSGATETIVVNLSGAATACVIASSITGADVSGTVANSFTDVQGGNGYGTAQAPTTGLTGSNTTMGFWGTDASGTITSESTELDSFLYSYASRYVMSDYNASGDATPTATTSSSTNWGCQTCEVKPASAGITVAIGISSETDTVPGVLTHSKSVTIGLPTETDTNSGFTPTKRYFLGFATETDSSLAMSAMKTVTVGLASETDTVPALSVAKSLAIGIASETDTLIPITITKSVTIGIATETDTVLAVTKAKGVTLGIATETDSAFRLGGILFSPAPLGTPPSINISISIGI